MFGDREQRFMGQGIKSASQTCEMKKTKSLTFVSLKFWKEEKIMYYKQFLEEVMAPNFPWRGKKIVYIFKKFCENQTEET